MYATITVLGLIALTIYDYCTHESTALQPASSHLSGTVPATPPRANPRATARAGAILEARYRLARTAVSQGFRCYNRLDAVVCTGGYYDSSRRAISLTAAGTNAVAATFKLDEAPGWAILAAAKGM